MKKNRLAAAALLVACASTFSKAHAQNTSPYWSLTGNSNASASSKLGTTNAIPLRLMTNNTTRIYITPKVGYIGMGTTNPTDRLHVNSDSGKNALRVQVHGATKMLVHRNGGVAVGSGATPPNNGLYVKGRGLFNTGLSVRNGGKSEANDTAGYAVFASGLGGGIYAEAAFDPDPENSFRYGTGLTAIGNIGIIAYGSPTGPGDPGRGIIGTGGWSGVEGRSSNYGVIATSSYVGVIGSGGGNLDIEEPGDQIGVLGQSTNIGVSGTGYVGIFGRGTQYAAWFEGAVLNEETYTTSDRNLKKDIKEFTGALNIINKLKPRYYAFKDDAKLASLHLPKGNHYGLIAQDVQEVLPNLVKEAPHKLLDTTTLQAQPNDGMVPDSHPKRKVLETMNISAVNYIELIPIMIRGMQELNEKTDEIEILKQKNEQLEQRLTKLEALLSNNGNSVTNLSLAYLEQNTPNPVRGTATIRYHVPQTATAANLTLTNVKGQLVKTITLDGNAAHLSLDTSLLAAGTYNYTLYVDGKSMDTKRMIVTH